MKNTVKILITVSLCVVLLVSLFFFVSCGPSWVGLNCQLSNDGSYYIVTGDEELGAVFSDYEIADTYKDLPVKAVGYKGFCNYSNLKKVVLPSTLEYIGDYAFFDCDKLESIIIPEGVKYIGESAFGECDNLTSVIIPSTVTFIGDEAFYGCPNLNYYQTEDAKYLGNEKNQKLMIEDTLSNQIQTFEIPLETKFVGSHAFDNCKQLEQVTFPNDLLGVGGWAFYGCENLTSVTLPDKVTRVGWYAFYNCVNLVSVTMPNSVKTIGVGVFENCANLQNVIISDGIIRSNMDVFKNCTNIKFNTYDNGFYLGSQRNPYALFVRAKQGYVDRLIIHPDTKVILDYSMQSCNMKTVVIPKGVVFVGQGAFHYCDELTSLTFEENSQLKEIMPSTFSYCKSLPSIQLPTGITKIGASAFSYCESLTSIVIPEGVTEVEGDAFGFCENLQDVTFPQTLIRLGEGVFTECLKPLTITFNGNKEQWENLDKERWNSGYFNGNNGTLSDYKVVCSDGEINK